MSQWLREQYTDGYFRRGTIEELYYERRELRPDQLAAMRYCWGKRRILSVGVGRGYLEHHLWAAGHDVTALDVRDNRHFLAFQFVLGGLEALPSQPFDCVLFCESIEHIPEDEFREAWPKIVNILRETKGRLVVVNWEHLHPIPHNGMDHVLRIDDEFYDWLATFGKTVVRRGSHLVLEFE